MPFKARKGRATTTRPFLFTEITFLSSALRIDNSINLLGVNVLSTFVIR
ncbi:hypothetical protein EZS27_014989 [termite gut metagenome]|uniref:Uncharacterized protein n=1 Tax=termite gut metagenome TaxID=433724 RepID=A0A5J4RTG9_9ZZZZ